MYVDFEYYSSVFNGSVLSERTFPQAEQEAETYIRYLTYLNGNIFADAVHTDSVKRTVCAAADVCYTARQEQEQGGNLKSESKDGVSVSFVVARKDNETVEQYLKRCMYQVIRPRLLPTGWLSRKAGGRNDNECKSCNCL